MAFSEIRFEPYDKDSHLFGKVYVDGEEIKNAISLEYRVAEGGIPQAILGLNADGLKANAQVLISFTPETLQQATKILSSEYLSNAYFRAAVIASIRSALNEPWRGDTREHLADKIADRVFGFE